MIELNWIDDKWYVFNEETYEFELRKDAPKEIRELYEENKKTMMEFESVFFGDFGKKKGKK